MAYNILFPPIVPDIAPAFCSNTLNFYFQISPYISSDDITTVEYTIKNQKTNKTILKTKKLVTDEETNTTTEVEIEAETAFTAMSYDSSTNKYFITLNEAFTTGQFYKIQLRFLTKDSESEWSKVCLLKKISQPSLKIKDFETERSFQFTDPFISVVGQLTFADSKETEFLKSYNIKLYQGQDSSLTENLLFDSGNIFTNSYNPNEIYYDIPYELQDGENYVIKFSYITNNLFQQSKNFPFINIQDTTDALNVTITATTDTENGRIRIDINSKNQENFIGNITIRRTSSKTNFHFWEDVHTTTYEENNPLNYFWYDQTIESGIWYKYCVQKRNSHGDRGPVVKITNPVMCILDYIFLTKADCQLKIKFNPTLNEIKYNVTESQQVTLGGKYPFIRRNGYNYFRTFPIGGLISSFIDTTDWYDPHHLSGNNFDNTKNEIKAFTSKNEIYGQMKEYYDNYNLLNNIDDYHDFIYEREFRNKVFDFLYKNDVKLFRSTTEGNILIKLMNIDFQPVETLGRMLYSFTATAVEIDQVNIQNLNKYNIQNLGTYKKIITLSQQVFGHSSYTAPAWSNAVISISDSDSDSSNKDVNTLFNTISKKHQDATQGFVGKAQDLKYLKLEFNSPPYLIDVSDLTKPIPWQSDNSKEKTITNSIIGYIISINGKKMIIPASPIGSKSTIFEIKPEDDVLIKSLEIYNNASVNVDYVATIVEEEAVKQNYDIIKYIANIGQECGTFTVQDSIFRKAYMKHFLEQDDFYQKLLEITNVNIEGRPGTVVYVKDSKDEDFDRHVLENGYLQLKDEEVSIEGLYFYGIHLKERTSGANEYVRQNEFIQTNETYDDFLEIRNPIKNGVYKVKFFTPEQYFIYNSYNYSLTVDSEYAPQIDDNNRIIKNDFIEYYLKMLQIDDDEYTRYIYYNDNWYLINQLNDVCCPIDAIVNYQYLLEEGTKGGK